MSTTTTPPPAPPGTPQVLLFGYTGAGKSALLGALLKAAETQGPTLRGEVLEASGRLASIRDAVYKGSELAPAAAELTSYTVRLRPWRDGTKAVAEPATVVVHDCSGKAAESLLAHPDAVRDARARAPVTRAVVEADAIILLVDGASTDDELLEAFEEFDTFLTIVARAKADAREVGGFPLHLVLTQCDRLAKPGDTRESWEARVQQRAERAWAKFDAFLKDADPNDGVPSPFLPFGSMDLTVYAVAVRSPRFGDSPPQPDTPYQVAELFRDSFAAAKSHRDRVSESDRLLKWTVRFALGFVSVLLATALLVGILQPATTGPDLAERVRGYRLNEKPAEERLAYPALNENRTRLAEFRNDRAFGDLPDDLKTFVEGRLKEIEDYETFRSKLFSASAPGDARTLEDLSRIEDRLGGELALPADYGWGKTGAAQLRDKWLADARAIRAKEEEFLARYRDLVRRGTVLSLRPSLGGEWRAEVGTLANEAAKPPVPLTDPLPGSPTVPQPRGMALTYRIPFEFERVYNARKEWDAVQQRLTHLTDLGDALGLTAGPLKPEPVLVLPEPGPGVDSAALPAARWTSLIRCYRTVSDDFREWDVRDFPDPLRSVLAERIDRSSRTGVRHVHALFRARMGADFEQKDTPEWWRSTADSLGDPATPFPDWGRLLHLLVRLRDPAAPNPVGELAAFLRRDKFELNLPGFSLLVPPDLGLEKAVPAGPLTVTLSPRVGNTATKTFKQSGPGVRDGSATVYRMAVEGDGKLTFAPGDELTIELPMRAGTQDFKLVWEASASRAYQFDKFWREPRAVRAGGKSEPAAGVRLTPTAGSTLPQLPVLFPDLKR